MAEMPSFSNILVRVPNWLGDTLMSTPAVSAVRAAFPQAKLTILCKSQYVSFWSVFPGVDQVVEFEKGFFGFWRTSEKIQKQDFDAALTFPMSFSSAFLLFSAGIPHRAGWGGEGREFILTHVVPSNEPRQKHLVWEYLELVRQGLGQPIPATTFQLSAPIDPKAQAEAQALLSELGVNEKQGLIALGPGATYGPAKRWPLAAWKELIDQLKASRPESLLVLGGPEEAAYLKELTEGDPKVLSLVGRTSPAVLAALLGKCGVLVTNDTGPMHVAAAVGTPAVALFGSTSPIWTRPFGTGHEVIYKNEECSPCFQRTCPIGYGCLTKITVQEVLSKVQGVLASGAKVEGEKVPVGVSL